MKFQERGPFLSLCLLTDGTVTYYDLATVGPYTDDNFKLIGKGIIYSINGVKQTTLNHGDKPSTDKLFYFYLRI